MRVCHRQLRRRLRRSGSEAGFTLVELLVVIAIIGLLVSLLMPAVQRARESARRTSCINNMRQVALATHNYLDAHKKFPSGWLEGPVHQRYYAIPLSEPIIIGQPGGAQTPIGGWVMDEWWGWQALLLPYMDQMNVRIDYDIHIKHDPSPNRPMVQVPIESYVCPSAPLPPKTADMPGYSSYRGNIGYWPNQVPLHNGLFHRNSDLDDRDVVDGLSNTIMQGETQYGMFWADSYAVARIRDDLGPDIFDAYWPSGVVPLTTLTLDGMQVIPADTLDFFSFGSFHGDVLNMSYADGSVHSVAKNVDGDVIRALCTRNGHETIGDGRP